MIHKSVGFVLKVPNFLLPSFVLLTRNVQFIVEKLNGFSVETVDSQVLAL